MGVVPLTFFRGGGGAFPGAGGCLRRGPCGGRDGNNFYQPDLRWFNEKVRVGRVPFMNTRFFQLIYIVCPMKECDKTLWARRYARSIYERSKAPRIVRKERVDRVGRGAHWCKQNPVPIVTDRLHLSEANILIDPSYGPQCRRQPPPTCMHQAQELHSTDGDFPTPTSLSLPLA